ncbi:hypothetical protein [Photobacterium damselae]|uniref:hypothetical protein n=1 Tax=Photobacterium damselae TaxID=38293 RepID=UPI000A2FE22E|nr:hypothetical protein [Photobacterium damselae]ARR51940.1 hypothetical protein CAY62_21310 [Photobacterium damselae subsp. damselae]
MSTLSSSQLGRAIQDAALTNLNDDILILIDTIESLPNKLADRLDPALEDAVQKCLTALELTNKQLNSDVDHIRANAILSLENSFNAVLDKKLSPDIAKIERLTNQLEQIQQPQKSKLSYVLFFISFIIAAIVGSSFSILFDKSISEDYKAQLKSTRFELNATDAAVQAGMDALSKKQRTIFFDAYKKQIDKEYGVKTK